MAWRLSGQWVELCSCKMLCRCVFGPAEPDQGWCSGGFVLDIQQGESDGLNLAGTRAALVIDLPKDFASGNGTARLYLDDGASAEQRRELEAILTGSKGGVWSAVAGIVAQWLPAQTAHIDAQFGATPRATVGNVAQLQLQPVTTEAGGQTRLTNAPAFGVFGVDSVDLASSVGSHWADPEMRRWEGGGQGSTASFSWSAA